MAIYDGVLAGYRGEIINAERLMGRRAVGAFIHSTEKAHSGTYSIKLFPSEEYPPIWCGCDAGSRTISIYVWPNANTINCRIRVIDPDTLEIMGESVNVGIEAWEQLSVGFTAEKKCYMVILGNYTTGYEPSNRRACWFDDLMVE